MSGYSIRIRFIVLDPDPVWPERLDPVNIRPDPKHCPQDVKHIKSLRSENTLSVSTVI